MIKLSKMSMLKTGIIVSLVLSLLFALVASEAGVNQIPDECKNALEEAAEAFDVKEYSVVLDKFERCSPYGFEGARRKRAFRLLAQSTEKVFEQKQYPRITSILEKYPPSDLDLDSVTRTRLLEIQAVSYLESEESEKNRQKADEIIEHLLQSKEDYEPTRTYSQEFTGRVEQVRKNIESAKLSQEPKRKRKNWAWYVLGGAVISAAVTAIILSSQEKGDEELDGAPAPPQQPKY